MELVVKSIFFLFQFKQIVKDLCTVLDSNFLQSLVTFLAAFVAIYYANKIGNRQNKISEQLFRLSNSVSVKIHFNLNEEAFEILNTGSSHIYCEGVRINNEFDGMGGAILIPSNVSYKFETDFYRIENCKKRTRGKESVSFLFINALDEKFEIICDLTLFDHHGEFRINLIMRKEKVR